MKKYFFAIIVLVVVAVGVSYLFYSRQPAGNQSAKNNSSTASSAQNIPDGYLEYHSVEYQFSIFYPEDLTVKEKALGGGATTITFENEKDIKGFQIFIVPYAGDQVSEARFKEDDPSGLRTNLQNISVDGVTAASFESMDDSLGDTKEIWFIRGGYLYEVTTLKTLADWFAPIMQTWKFF